MFFRGFFEGVFLFLAGFWAFGGVISDFGSFIAGYRGSDGLPVVLRCYLVSGFDVYFKCHTGYLLVFAVLCYYGALWPDRILRTFDPMRGCVSVLSDGPATA